MLTDTRMDKLSYIHKIEEKLTDSYMQQYMTFK